MGGVGGFHWYKYTVTKFYERCLFRKSIFNRGFIEKTFSVMQIVTKVHTRKNNS